MIARLLNTLIRPGNKGLAAIRSDCYIILLSMRGPPLGWQSDVNWHGQPPEIGKNDLLIDACHALRRIIILHTSKGATDTWCNLHLQTADVPNFETRENRDCSSGIQDPCLTSKTPLIIFFQASRPFVPLLEKITSCDVISSARILSAGLGSPVVQISLNSRAMAILCSHECRRHKHSC